jgi:hypothetical protein
MDKWKREMVDAANRNNACMDGTMAPVREILSSADVVFAVWQDAAEMDGVGYMIVKGEDVLRRIVENQLPAPVRQTAIACINIEQAMALLQVCGERKRWH